TLRTGAGTGTERRPRDGTAEPDEPVQESNGGSRLTGRAAVLLLVMLVLLISYASSLRAWLQQREDTEQARTEISEAQHRIDELEREKQRLDDPAYVKTLARERFGWLMPGETGYTTLDADGDVPGDDNTLTDPTGEDDDASNDQEWFVEVWGSVRSAGEEPDDDGEERKPEHKPNKKRIVRPDRTAQ
ncbi:MAG: septum formation initiator family protein, partial [Actinomycetia bacterium]|nr:septum formation initiator family protein [Actinomycetes bacterium]